MALNNCTINKKIVSVPSGQALGSGVANQVLTITPFSGYVVRAADFTDNTSISGSGVIQSITLSDSDAPYTLANTVLVTVDLRDAFVPTANVTGLIDIDGDALLSKFVPRNLSGTISNTLVDATVNNAETSYSASGSFGSQTTVFTRTYTASTGKYFVNEPSYLTSDLDNPSDYKITSTKTYTGSGGVNFLTAKTFTVEYIFPDHDVTGDILRFDARATGTIPATNTTKFINSVTTKTTPMGLGAVTRRLSIYGDVGAQVDLSMVNEDNTAYNFTNQNFDSGATVNITIGNTGVYVVDVIYPTVTDPDQYDFTLTTVPYSGSSLHSSLDSDSNGIHTFSVQALADVNWTITVNSASGRSYTSTPSQVYTGSVDSVVAASLRDKTFNLMLTDDESMYMKRLPLVSDFVAVNTSGQNGNSDMNISTITTSSAINTALSSILFIVNGRIDSFGTANSSHTLALDNFINLPSVTSNSSFTANPTGDTVHGLTYTNPDNDTLTFTVTQAPTQGTVSIDNGVATYSRSLTGTGNDLFRYKVNDGTQDSNVATVSITAGSSSSFSYVVNYKWKDNNLSSPTENNLSGAFSGTLTAQNFTAGSENDLTLQVSDWDLDDTHAGIPTYMTDVYDYDEVFYRLKNNSDQVIAHGQIPIIYTGSGASVFDAEARTGTVQTSTLDTNTNNLADEPHTLEIVIIYDNNPTP